MTSNHRLALVLDKSETWVRFKRNEILSSWNVSLDETDSISSLTEAGATDIFGDSLVPILHLPDSNHVKKVTKELEDIGESLLERTQDGLLISGTVSRNSTKKLEKLVTVLGGTVCLSKKNSKDKTNPIIDTINGLSVTRDVKDFLRNYSGADYSLILGVVESLKTLSPQQQSRITIEDMLIRLPQSPGAIPPWEINTPLFERADVNQTVTTFERITLHTHHLVVLSLLKTKLSTAYNVLSIKDAGVTDLSRIASTMGVANNYQFKTIVRLGEQLGLQLTRRLLSEVVEVESQVKSGTRIDEHMLVKVSLIRMCLLIRHNRSKNAR